MQRFPKHHAQGNWRDVRKDRVAKDVWIRALRNRFSARHWNRVDTSYQCYGSLPEPAREDASMRGHFPGRNSESILNRISITKEGACKRKIARGISRAPLRNSAYGFSAMPKQNGIWRTPLFSNLLILGGFDLFSSRMTRAVLAPAGFIVASNVHYRQFPLVCLCYVLSRRVGRGMPQFRTQFDRLSATC